MTTKNWQTATKDISFLSVQLVYRSCALEHYHYGMGIYYGRMMEERVSSLKLSDATQLPGLSADRIALFSNILVYILLHRGPLRKRTCSKHAFAPYHPVTILWLVRHGGTTEVSMQAAEE